MNRHCTQSFVHGLLLGMGLALVAGILLAMASDNRNDGSHPVEPKLFVTGDTNNATLWRRGADGSLTCVSRNICRAPERTH